MSYDNEVVFGSVKGENVLGINNTDDGYTDWGKVAVIAGGAAVAVGVSYAVYKIFSD